MASKVTEISAGDGKRAGIGSESAVTVAAVDAAAAPRHLDPLVGKKFGRRIALRPAGTTLGPEVLLALGVGLLALGASIAPWPRHGWLWFEWFVTALTLLVCYDAIALWLTRKDGRP